MLAYSMIERLSAAGPAVLPLLLDAAIKGVAILALTALAALALRRSSAAARHLVWFLGTLGLLVLPILSAGLPGWHILPRWAMNAPAPAPISAAPAMTPVMSALPDVVASTPTLTPPAADLQNSPDESAAEPVASASASPATSAARPQTPAQAPAVLPWQAWVLLIWLAGSALLLGHIAMGFLSLRWLRRRATRITQGDWPALVRGLCAQLGIRRPVELLTSPRRNMPMTWGLWRTRLLLPADAGTWPADQRQTVLLHELAHARRWDCLTQLITQIVCALYWFNPLAWLASRRMQAERERACDDLVLRTGTKASAYAEQLLHIASEMPAIRFSAAAIAMARPSKLEGRLLAILDMTRNRRALTWSATTLAALLMVTFAVPLAMVRAENGKAEADARKLDFPDEAVTVVPRPAPRLRFLAWQTDKPEELVQGWRPDGTPVTNADDTRLLASINLSRAGNNDGVRFLNLWFADPTFDIGSDMHVSLTHRDGRPLFTPPPGVFVSNVTPAKKTLDNTGWAQCIVSLGQPADVPDVADIALRYSSGDWHTGQRFDVDFTGAVAIDTGVGLAAIGQDARGEAFLTISRDAKKSPEKQYDFLAITNDGRTLTRDASRTTSLFDTFHQTFTFKAPLADVKEFRLRTRPLRTIIFKNVALRVGVSTQPETAEGTPQPAPMPKAMPAPVPPTSAGPASRTAPRGPARGMSPFSRAAMPAGPGEGPTCSLDATVYELRMPPEQIGQIDMDALAKAAATPAALEKALAGMGSAKPLYRVRQSVRLSGDSVVDTTQVPVVTGSRMTATGQVVNSVRYQPVGAVYTISGKPLAEGRIELDLNIEVATLKEGDVPVAPNVMPQLVRMARINHKGPVDAGRPFVAASIDAASLDAAGKAVGYVARITLGAPQPTTRAAVLPAETHDVPETGTTQPAATRPAATLDFRVAAQIGGDGNSPAGNLVPADLAAKYIRDLEQDGPQDRAQLARGFAWFEVGDADVANWITGSYKGRRYILLMTVDPYIMLAERDGERAWGLKRVFTTLDDQGHTAISFVFDAAGAERFGKLTETNLRRPLAILMNGKAISVPVVQSKISDAGIIQGGANGFDPAVAREIVAALSSGMPPTTSPSSR